MKSHNHSTFTTIHSEGALLPTDLLQRILNNDRDLKGLSPVDYHLSEREKLNEVISSSWNRLQGYWAAFRTEREKLPEKDFGTGMTRDKWLLPLFTELGFGRLAVSKAVEINGKTFPISHTWSNVPIHLVGCNIALDRISRGVAGAARVSPHSLVQEYLNLNPDSLWGIFSNGLLLRLVRDNTSLSRQAYLEFDLEAMFDGEVFSDFGLLWLICHQSRFELAGPSGESECWLEKWSKESKDRGTRALDRLRDGVEKAIEALGQGFLQHPANNHLREALHGGHLTSQDYYRQVLRLVYRVIFIITAEDRGLLHPDNTDPKAAERYDRYYSVSRLRRLAERKRGTRHGDLYQQFCRVSDLLGSREGCPSLGLPALGGFLFALDNIPDLQSASLQNTALLEAIRSLTFLTEGNTRRIVDYRNLGPEELGSIYESLLELHPNVDLESGQFSLIIAAGSERKTTGSYYTPTSLIQVLLDSALDPVIEDRLKGKAELKDQEEALLSLKVCDPACGSGHFLIAAAHRIARRLAAIRSGGNEPPPNFYRHCLREVISHCIYGVDINPMSVELCKVNLWLEAIEPGKPLTFLDAHIKCGNSLVGVGPETDYTTIPDEAFNPVFGDHKPTAAYLKKRNARERVGQISMLPGTYVATAEGDISDLGVAMQQILAMPEDTADQVYEKFAEYLKFSESHRVEFQRLACDLWTAAFFWPIKEQPGSADVLAPSQGVMTRFLDDEPIPAELRKAVKELSEEQRFFHWEAEYPEVFRNLPGSKQQEQEGFDCVIGNPPWERIKLQEEEFFSVREPAIAAAPNKAARQRLIDRLPETHPSLALEFSSAKHAAECYSKYVRESRRFPLTAVGDVNNYALFAEHFRGLMGGNGRAGVIVPTGIATDDTTKDFFGDLVEKRGIASLFDFENREAIFPGVHRSYKFCLLTLSGSPVGMADFVFFATRVEHLRDSRRRFRLNPLEIAKFNQNTRTMPVFRTKCDSELTKKIYQCIPILQNDSGTKSPWGLYYMRFVHLGDHSEFIKYPWQEREKNWNVPLYESKLFWFYDHRYATFGGCSKESHLDGQPREMTTEEKREPSVYIESRYFVPREFINQLFDKYPSHNKDYLILWRDVTNATNERTCICTIVPRVASTVTCPGFGYDISQNPNLILANLNSIAFDYVARQKVPGMHLGFGILKQLPAISPVTYTPSDIGFINSRVIELVYTANDLRLYAEDMGYKGEPFKWDEERRALLRSELDAYYARLYGLNHKQLRYILDPADLTPKELEDILDPYEEVQDALDPAGYNQRRTTSDFPGETFRVLKEKEIRQFSEYRTRRLVLEAWERLKDVEIGNPEGYKQPPVEDPIELNSARTASSTSANLQAIPEIREEVIIEEPPVVVEKTSPKDQPMLSDFGLYKCSLCGKHVMGYDKEVHRREKHHGDFIQWRKIN